MQYRERKRTDRFSGWPSLPSYDGVYSRAQKAWVNSTVRVGGEERKRKSEAAQRTRRSRVADASIGARRRRRRKRKKQGGRRRQQSLVSRLILLPPSHLIAFSHATSGRVGVSGRLKKHGRLRPSIQKKTVDLGRRERDSEGSGQEE